MNGTRRDAGKTRLNTSHFLHLNSELNTSVFFSLVDDIFLDDHDGGGLNDKLDVSV